MALFKTISNGSFIPLTIVMVIGLPTSPRIISTASLILKPTTDCPSKCVIKSPDSTPAF